MAPAPPANDAFDLTFCSYLVNSGNQNTDWPSPLLIGRDSLRQSFCRLLYGFLLGWESRHPWPTQRAASRAWEWGKFPRLAVVCPEAWFRCRPNDVDTGWANLQLKQGQEESLPAWCHMMRPCLRMPHLQPCPHSVFLV